MFCFFACDVLHPLDNGREESGGRGERPPPGLKGREIGMWFARRSKAKKEQQEKMNVS